MLSQFLAAETSATQPGSTTLRALQEKAQSEGVDLAHAAPPATRLLGADATSLLGGKAARANAELFGPVPRKQHRKPTGGAPLVAPKFANQPHGKHSLSDARLKIFLNGLAKDLSSMSDVQLRSKAAQDCVPVYTLRRHQAVEQATRGDGRCD